MQQLQYNIQHVMVVAVLEPPYPADHATADLCSIGARLVSVCKQAVHHSLFQLVKQYE